MSELFSKALADEFRRDLSRLQISQAKAQQREAFIADHKPNPREHRRKFPDKESAMEFARTLVIPPQVVRLREGYEVMWLTRPSVSVSDNSRSPAVVAEAQATPLSPGYRVLTRHGQESTPVDHIRTLRFPHVFDAVEEYNTVGQYNIAWRRLLAMDSGQYVVEYGFSTRYEKQLSWKQVSIPKMYRTNRPRKRR